MSSWCLSGLEVDWIQVVLLIMIDCTRFGACICVFYVQNTGFCEGVVTQTVSHHTIIVIGQAGPAATLARPSVVVHDMSGNEVTFEEELILTG
jgi:hypothetical protein